MKIDVMNLVHNYSTYKVLKKQRYICIPHYGNKFHTLSSVLQI